MTLIGYMRVSKADGSQDTALQLDALLQAGVAREHIYEDHASGAKDDRPQLAACLKALRPGDKLVAWHLDRVGRSTSHLLQLVEDLGKRQIDIQFLTGTLAFDTSTPMGKFMFTLAAGLAELERGRIIERTKAGLAAARARGRIGGRRPALTKAKLKIVQAAMKQPETNVAALAKEMGVHSDTIYQYVDRKGELRDLGRKVMGTE